MSVTSGFFNSLNGDRKYNAEQFSSLFNGIINDGVFTNIGTAFAVTASIETTVKVGIGRAWFKGIWLLNDSILPVTLDESEVILDRIDAVVIEIDRSDAVREGSIKVIKGTPSHTPTNPTLSHTAHLDQYPLAYIYRAAGSTVINQADIQNMIGTSFCPYVTGILEVVNIDNLVAQWEDQWTQWFENETQQSEQEADTWFNESKAEFDAWFESLVDILDSDVAASLAAQILDIQERFEILVREKAVYDDLYDSNNEPIKDSYNSTIEAKTVLSSVDETQIQSIWDSIYDIEDTSSTPIRVDVVLSADNWTNLSQTVSVPGVMEDESAQIIQAIPKSTSKDVYENYGIEPSDQGMDTVTFTADIAPSVDVDIYVVIQKVLAS